MNREEWVARLKNLDHLRDRGMISKLEYDKAYADLIASLEAFGLHKGEQFAQYTVIDRIGEGGMGVVYLAERHRQEGEGVQRVALKVLRDHLKDLERVRFKEEGAKGLKIKREMQSDQIAEVFELVEHNGRLGLAMEFIEGPTLDELPVGSLSELASLLTPLAELLDTIHSMGIIHRDIKPKNIKIHPARGPVLLDFGVAKDHDLELTSTSQVIGTPIYMSPEQLDRSNPVTGASDQYALALLLYKYTTGTFPWGDQLSTIGQVVAYKISGEDPKWSKELGLRLSKHQFKSLARGMSKNPAHRFPSCVTLLETIKLSSAESDAHKRSGPKWFYLIALIFVGLASLGVTWSRLESCQEEPCEHGAACVNQLVGFKCECPPGYSGARCEVNMNDCEGVSCENGGSCIDLVDQFECSCPPGYSGARCEVNMNDCEGVVCGHGGRCRDQVNGYQCECSAGYTGDHCELPEIKWINVPKGSITIKSGKFGNKKPHIDMVFESFEMSEAEITVQQYRACVEAKACSVPKCKSGFSKKWQNRIFGTSTWTPDPSKQEDHPITCVTWFQAREFAQWIGEGVDLPTDAEWEYAARSGYKDIQYPSANRLDEVAWYSENARRDGHLSTHPVKLKRPNSIGLYDMLGNVWEWTFECSSPEMSARKQKTPDSLVANCSKHLVRGGAFNSAPGRRGNNISVTRREDDQPQSGYGTVGFRLRKEAKSIEEDDE